MNRVNDTGRFLLRTLVRILPTAIGIVLVVFLLLRLVPGDLVDVMAGESGSATEASMAQLRAAYGLDLPMFSQLVTYLNHLLHFSLGFSPRYNSPVMTLILSRLPATLLLMLLAQALALAIGILCGAIMATWVNKWPDRLLSLIALLLYSMPGFWIGLMALLLFSVQLGWLPSGGSHTIGANLRGWAYIWDMLRHAVLPVLALSSFFIAIYARLTRAAMLEIAQQDFVRTAHAKGLGRLAITLRHILRCALLPITTVAGMYFGSLLGGAAVVETVFSWPGLGSLALDAMIARDFNVLLGVLLLSAFLVILANVLVDTLQHWLDPRIEAQ